MIAIATCHHTCTYHLSGTTSRIMLNNVMQKCPKQPIYTHAQPNTVPLNNFVISRKNTVNVNVVQEQEQEQTMFTLCQRKKLHLHKSLILCISFSRACILVHYRRSNCYCIICNLINLTHLLIVWFKHFTIWWWCVKQCSDFD